MNDNRSKLAISGSGNHHTCAASPCDHRDLFMVVVFWKIKPDRDDEFLSYWSEHEAIADRSGLVYETLSRQMDEDIGFVEMLAPTTDYTSFINVGVWKDVEAFRSQIGIRIDDRREPLPFEYERRGRLFLNPKRWRVGRADPVSQDHPLVT